MNKIIIGIVAKHGDLSKIRPDTLIRDEIKDAVFYNGAVAIGVIPSMKEITLVGPRNETEIYQNLNNMFSKKEIENMVAQIEMCDGIILSGGIASDAYEVWVAKYCHENNIPILAVCAGENNLVRAVGGTTKKVDDSECHDQQAKEYVHSIKVESGSLLHKMIEKEKIEVNSRHKRVIDNPSILQVSATDEHGNIEAVEDKSKTCFMGLRFHPESLYLTDENHNNIIKKFIEICSNVKRENLDL